jgi:hypothetical protein
MRQMQFFSSAELAAMRDRTASRRYSAERETFRREHERHRAWGLARRHADRLRRAHSRPGQPAAEPTGKSREVAQLAARAAEACSPSPSVPEPSSPGPSVPEPSSPGPNYPESPSLGHAIPSPAMGAPAKPSTAAGLADLSIEAASSMQPSAPAPAPTLAAVGDRAGATDGDPVQRCTKSAGRNGMRYFGKSVNNPALARSDSSRNVWQHAAKISRGLQFGIHDLGLRKSRRGPLN